MEEKKLSSVDTIRLVKQLREIEQIENLEVDFDGTLTEDLHYNKFLLPYSYFMGKLTLKRDGSAKNIKAWEYKDLVALLDYLQRKHVTGLRVKVLKEILKTELSLRKLAKIEAIKDDSKLPSYRPPNIKKDIL